MVTTRLMAKQAAAAEQPAVAGGDEAEDQGAEGQEQRNGATQEGGYPNNGPIKETGRWQSSPEAVRAVIELQKEFRQLSLLPKRPLQRLIVEICKNVAGDYKWTRAAFNVIVHSCELVAWDLYVVAQISAQSHNRESIKHEDVTEALAIIARSNGALDRIAKAYCEDKDHATRT